MEMLLLRGYVNRGHEQTSYYFENTAENIANFIFRHAAEDNEIVINTIFGKNLMTLKGRGNALEGKEKYLEPVRVCLAELEEGRREVAKVTYLDLEDLNDKDEFDSPDLKERWIEDYVNNHEF